MDLKVERVVLETDRYRITGGLSLPKEGYRSRLSDYLNRGDAEFVPLVDVEVVPVNGGEAESVPFLAVSRAHIHIAYPLDSE